MRDPKLQLLVLGLVITVAGLVMVLSAIRSARRRARIATWPIVLGRVVGHVETGMVDHMATHEVVEYVLEDGTKHTARGMWHGIGAADVGTPREVRVNPQRPEIGYFQQGPAPFAAATWAVAAIGAGFSVVDGYLLFLALALFSR